MSGDRTAFIAIEDKKPCGWMPPWAWMPEWAVAILRVDGGFRIFDSIKSFHEFGEFKVRRHDVLFPRRLA